MVISRGPEYIKNRDFINRESTKYGYFIKGEYFNCEMDIRKKNTIKHLVGAFMPFNKTPKTAWTSIMMGIRQIRLFIDRHIAHWDDSKQWLSTFLDLKPF